MERTITELLSELKTLGARIEKGIQSGTFVASQIGEKAPTSFTSKAEFETKAKADFESVIYLIARRNKIKSAIVISNAKTLVSVGGTVYSVAEAIERKSSIAYEKQLVDRLTRVFNAITSQVELSNNGDVLRRLDQQINLTFGTDKKSSADEVELMTKTFLARNELKVLDPLKIRDLTTNLNDAIIEFEQNIDVQLSIANATTVVEI